MAKKIVDENGKVYVEKKRGGCLRTIGILILALVVIGVAINQLGGGTSSNTTTSQSSNLNTAETTESVEVFDYTATEIIDTFEANELKGKETYTGKRANITGTVDSIGETFGQTYVTMKTDSTDFSLTGLQFFFKEGNTTGLSDLSQGDVVTIQGTIGEKSLNVEIKDSVLMQ